MTNSLRGVLFTWSLEQPWIHCVLHVSDCNSTDSTHKDKPFMSHQELSAGETQKRTVPCFSWTPVSLYLGLVTFFNPRLTCDCYQNPPSWWCPLVSSSQSGTCWWLPGGGRSSWLQERGMDGWGRRWKGLTPPEWSSVGCPSALNSECFQTQREYKESILSLSLRL